MQKIKKLHVLSKKPIRSNVPYSPIFSRSTKIFLFSGLLLMIAAGFFYLNETIQLAYVTPHVSEVATKNAKVLPNPTSLSIPSLKLSLPVEQTQIINNVWNISDLGVSHLAITANPGELGPGIYYGHNTNKRFGPIRWLKKGAVINIITSDGGIHPYMVTETVQTDPKNMSVFFTRKHEAIYLFTCDGFADLKRFVVVAEPITPTP